MLLQTDFRNSMCEMTYNWNSFVYPCSARIELFDASAQICFHALMWQDEARAVSKSHVNRRWYSMCVSVYDRSNMCGKLFGARLWVGSQSGDKTTNCLDSIPIETGRSVRVYARQSAVPAERATTNEPVPTGRDVLYLGVILANSFCNFQGTIVSSSYLQSSLDCSA